MTLTGLPRPLHRHACWSLLSLLLLMLGCGAEHPFSSVATEAHHSTSPGNDLAALAASADGFRSAEASTALVFPRDHGAHEDYRIEWWYLTANLEDPNGEPYGAQWTLFRVARKPSKESKQEENPWQNSQIYMAHFAISTKNDHVSFQRYARGGSHGGIRRAGSTATPFAAWLDDWELNSTKGQTADLKADDWLPLTVSAQARGYGLRLDLSSEQALVLQGDKGFSRKHHNGGGSHYYSHPFLNAQGELVINGKSVAVSGQAWLDREWSSQFLQGDQSGWDWFALHLDSGEKLMLFQLRPTADTASDASGFFRHGVLISPNGRTTELDSAAIALQPKSYGSVAGRNIPVRWQITLPELERSLEVEALHPEQWMEVDFAYWEGYVTVRGASAGERGRGYLEMVGYPPNEGKQ
ncbi:MAG: lipocalin-like domain-containing protein [Pseudomonadota bacterium]